MKVVKPPVKKVTKDPLYEVECSVTEHSDFVTGDLIKVIGPFMSQDKVGHISHIYICEGVYFFDIVDKTDASKVYTVWGDNAIIKI